jgi:hypothetical protein
MQGAEQLKQGQVYVLNVFKDYGNVTCLSQGLEENMLYLIGLRQRELAA